MSSLDADALKGDSRVFLFNVFIVFILLCMLCGVGVGSWELGDGTLSPSTFSLLFLISLSLFHVCV